MKAQLQEAAQALREVASTLSGLTTDLSTMADTQTALAQAAEPIKVGFELKALGSPVPPPNPGP